MKVLIAGGGFCGVEVAKILEKEDLELTIIDKSGFFEYTPSAHKLAFNQTQLGNFRAPIERILRSTQVVRGTIREITPESVITEEESFDFDILLIALGAKYPVFLENKRDVYPLGTLSDGLKIGESLPNAKRILIVGGGLVGTEFAAEMATRRDKELTLVHAKERLLERNPVEASDYAKRFLDRHETRLIFGQKVISHEMDSYLTDKGEKLSADLCIWCAGFGWDFSLMRGFGVQPKGALPVNNFLHLDGYSNVFVGGDANDFREEKSAQNAERQAWFISRNIVSSIKDLPLRPYTSRKGPLVISLGKSNGLIIYKGRTFAGPIPALAKNIVEKYTLSRQDGIMRHLGF